MKKRNNDSSRPFFKLNCFEKSSLYSPKASKWTQNIHICLLTFTNRLRKYNIIAIFPATNPQLTREHRLTTLAFAREHADWGVAEWSNFRRVEIQSIHTAWIYGCQFTEELESNMPSANFEKPKVMVEDQLWYVVEFRTMGIRIL